MAKNKRFLSLILITIATALTLVSTIYAYDVFVNNRFRVVNPGKVYKSGLMDIDKLEKVVSNYNIKSIIDLRNPDGEDGRGGGSASSIISELSMADRMGVNYFSLPSGQVPQEYQIERFLKIMDDPDNYPVLIHCLHGKGRAEIYSAIYRIEYQDYLNVFALEKTRFLPTNFTSFSSAKAKGKFILSYSPRTE